MADLEAMEEAEAGVSTDSTAARQAWEAAVAAR